MKENLAELIANTIIISSTGAGICYGSYCAHEYGMSLQGYIVNGGICGGIGAFLGMIPAAIISGLNGSYDKTEEKESNRDPEKDTPGAFGPGGLR